MTPTLWLDLIRTFVIAGAAGVTVYNINAWRREVAGKREYELAEEVLALFYEARDRIRFMRFPLGHAEEGTSRKTSENESPEQKQARDQAYVLIERYRASRETFNRLHALEYRFMALFGRDKAAPFVELRKVVSEMHASAQILSRLWSERAYRRQRDEKMDALIDKQEHIFWEMGEDDALSMRIDKAIATVEATCQPIIRASTKPGVWSALRRWTGRARIESGGPPPPALTP
jgi:hypothetical protein